MRMKHFVIDCKQYLVSREGTERAHSQRSETGARRNK